MNGESVSGRFSVIQGAAMVSDYDLNLAARQLRFRLTALLDSLDPEHPDYMPDLTNPDTRRAVLHRHYKNKVERGTRSRPREGSASGDAPLTFSEWEGVVW